MRNEGRKEIRNKIEKMYRGGEMRMEMDAVW